LKACAIRDAADPSIVAFVRTVFDLGLARQIRRGLGAFKTEVS
jgi:hypothetical protein